MAQTEKIRAVQELAAKALKWVTTASEHVSQQVRDGLKKTSDIIGGMEAFLKDLSRYKGIKVVIRAMDQISRTAYIKRNVAKGYYNTANKILESIRQGIVLLSGGFGFFLLNSLSVESALLLSMVCFFVAAILTSFLTKEQNVRQSEQKIANKKLLYEGVAFFFTDKNTRLIRIYSILPYASVVSLNVLYPGLFMSLTDNIKSFAFLVIPYGLGTMIAPFFPYKIKGSFNKIFIVYYCIFCSTMVIPLILKTTISIYVCLFFIAFCHSKIRVERTNYVMNCANNSNIGRLISFSES